MSRARALRERLHRNQMREREERQRREHEQRQHERALMSTEDGTALALRAYYAQERRALELEDEHARANRHPFDHAFALTLGAQVFAYRREPAELLRRTDEAERVGRAHGAPLLSEILA